jgi:hypothetical protein
MGILSQVSELVAAFERTAERAPWVRARFFWQQGFCSGITFERPGHDDIQSYLPGHQLQAMSAQAGELAARMYKLGWRPSGSFPNAKAVYSEPQDFWVDLLTQFTRTGYLCYIIRHGTRRLEAVHIDYVEPEWVYIDNYPDVCLILLTWMKTEASKRSLDIEASKRSLDGDETSDQERLHFDEKCLTIYLDGKPYRITNPNTFKLYQTIADAKAAITRRQIRSQLKRGFSGSKQIPAYLAKLPKELRTTVKSGPTGYWLQLPDKRSTKGRT